MRASFIYLLLLLCASQAKCYDYFYWKDFAENDFPSDAFEVDSGIFIGQSRFSTDEKCVGNIFRGIAEYLNVGCNGYNSQHSIFLVKVLCTDRPQDFAWLRTSATTFLNDTVGKTLVQGGFVNDPYIGPLYIGRTRVNGEVGGGVVVGNIRPLFLAHPDEMMVLYYALTNGTLSYESTFEVLIYVG